MKTEKQQTVKEVGGEPCQQTIMRTKVGFQKAVVLSTNGVEKTSNQIKIANAPVASALTTAHTFSIVAEAWQLWSEE